MSGLEAPLVQEVFDSNWIAPLGSQVDAASAFYAPALNKSPIARTSTHALRFLG
jgi:hypothetical protein